jgi:hypothetical protein
MKRMSFKIKSHPRSRFRVGNGRGLLGLVVMLFGSLGFTASAQPTNASARPDYSTFKIVTERNIFNPHRYARSSRSRESRPTSKADSFALVGIMSYEKGTFAFFDGSKSEFRKVLKPAETIAGYTVTDIAPNSVKLNSGTNAIELNVGNQMRREEEGEWRLSTASESATGTRSASVVNRRGPDRRPTQAETPAETADSTETQPSAGDASSQAVLADGASDPASTNAAPDGASSETDDPVLRRLMQRREQEINR